MSFQEVILVAGETLQIKSTITGSSQVLAIGAGLVIRSMD